ncbi:hypothetical protein CYY_005995 [Polysphondylium violaceum]|uniref:G-protein coupled receptors family 3 profile domain-containing protein n=1 Tax=Polysphondylium violaceum TaxID=133409 RepID=A0A8J4V6C4_9MYCE|nr:hypothetical protein CYY_005995 [Polysphondylium violaceum]
MATILSGDPSDMGFNYMVNQGRIETEKYLGIVESKAFENVPEDGAAPIVKQLVQEEYDFVVCSSLGFINDCKEAASTTNRTVFLIRGSSNPTLSSVYITYNYASCNYISGYFAGLVTKTNMVGFITAGPPTINISNANAFFVGARKSNPKVTMLFYTVGEWINSDVTRAATNDLLDRGCDIIGTTQDDMSAGEEVLARENTITLGTNGYPQRKVFGEGIQFSYVYNWTKHYSAAAEMVFNKTFASQVPAKLKFYGDFDTGFITLDYGVFVSDEIKVKVENERNYLASIPRAQHPYICNEYNKYVNIPNGSITGDCMTTAYFFRLDQPYPGMEYLGKYEIQLVKVDFGKNIQYGFSIVGGCCIFICLLAVIGILKYKDTPSIRSASPIFLIFIICGGIIVYGGIILWVSGNTTQTCNARFWLVSLGFSTLIGSLVVKNFRIWLIFDNPELKTVKITNFQLFPWVGVVVAINILLMAVLTGYGGLRSTDAQNIDNIGKYEYMSICTMDGPGHATLYTLLGYFAALLLVGVFVSWKIRIVDIEEFNESKAIAKTLYAISFCLFIIIPLMTSPQDQKNQTIILAAAGLFIVCSALAILFVPKFWRIKVYGHGGSNEMFTQKKSSNIASSRAESASKNSEGNSSGQHKHTTHTTRRGLQNDFTDDSESSAADVPPPKPSLPSGPVLAEFTDDSASDTDNDHDDPIGDDA